MKIRNMFARDINRPINAVVQVGQKTNAVLAQEIDEYVITKELKKHFMTFFTNYTDSFDRPTQDIGVWISGFFGSGKSHFLKMLSYLLENKEIGGKKVVEWFRDKFEDDPLTFSLIDKATRGPTKTILFDIDVEGFSNKDKTVVLRTFAKMFYNYLGFYGENLKVARLEMYIDREGKTEEFRQVYKEIAGADWLEDRDVYTFHEDQVTEALKRVLGMSEISARHWFDLPEEDVETSIARLVQEMKAYVEKQPKDFRLLFMIDEVGQYVGADKDLLLNLQSLVEKIGSECMGKIWVVCTGQEALDALIKARTNEFSRIQDRFHTRLSLTSASADEVVRERILKKNEEALPVLENVYKGNDSVLRNLFTFSGALMDIKGYSSDIEFTRNFPFVPYQFLIVQKAFNEIRRHGNVGFNTSKGERTMLSGFQAAAQQIEDRDEYSLAPLYRFYDTIKTKLDTSISQVIERCTSAGEKGEGIEPQDVNVLKLLYLIRYIDDIPANLDNLTILMADDIRVDKIQLRKSVGESLNRLLKENYIGRNGDTYQFLTDEEQDIAKEISQTSVDTAEIVKKMGDMVYEDIYSAKKKRYGNADFPFDRWMDDTSFGNLTGGLKLKILSDATDITEKNTLTLTTESKGAAIVVLPEATYYDTLERSLKIKKYVRQRNVQQLPQSVQAIIRARQDEAESLQQEAREALAEAITKAAFYVDGEMVDIKSGSAVEKLNQALDLLVKRVYKKFDMIEAHADSDEDIRDLLTNSVLIHSNEDAEAEIEEYLDIHEKRHLPTSMGDIQKQFQGIPYGWKEIDVAYVMAGLIAKQLVTVKYGGTVIAPDDPRLVDMLRKKSEIGKTSISKRQAVSRERLREAREILTDIMDEMNIPDDEDGFIAYVKKWLSDTGEDCQKLLSGYRDSTSYPDKQVLSRAADLVGKLRAASNDNIAFIQAIIDREDDLYDARDNLEPLKNFFDTQVEIFDQAKKMLRDLDRDRDYIREIPEADKALNRIRAITYVEYGKPFDYGRIPELPGLMEKVKTTHDQMVGNRRNELLESIRQCLSAIHEAAGVHRASLDISRAADEYYTDKKNRIMNENGLTVMDGLESQMWKYRDNILERIHAVQEPEQKDKNETKEKGAGYGTTPKPKTIRSVPRQSVFPGSVIRSEEEIDSYVNHVRETMQQLLKDHGGFRIN
jgi:hypothetical protein